MNEVLLIAVLLVCVLLVLILLELKYLRMAVGAAYVSMRSGPEYFNELVGPKSQTSLFESFER